MRIKYIKEDDLSALRQNLPQIYDAVFLSGEMTIKGFFENDELICETAILVDDFKLDMSQPKGRESLTDVENIKRVYNHMKFLSDSQASDERLWSAYTFSEFKDYMCYRWPAKSASDLENRYLFGYSAQRSLFRNGISRLWWLGRFTYDDSRENPYELTEYLCSNQDFIETICGRNIFNNQVIGNSVIVALYDAHVAGVVTDRETIRDIAKYVNLLAGTYLIDTFTKEEIYNKIREKLGF